MGTYEASEILKELLHRMPDLCGVTIGPWSMTVRLDRTGTVLAKLDFSMRKKGWSPPKPPPEEPKPAKKKKATKKAAGRKRAKSAG
jgi:hypothetical protein